MKGHGEKLGRKQELAIIALLNQPTVEEAAQAVGLSQVTLWRWMQLDDFRAQYRAARRQALENGIARLQGTTGEAVGALRRNLACGAPSVEVRAAQVILEQAAKGVELIELEARIEALEQQLAAAAEPRQGGGKLWRT